MYITIIILVITLFSSGFFSAAETAFTSLSELQVKLLHARYPLRGKAINYLYNHSALLLGTILIGNNASNFIFSVASTSLTLTLFGSHALAIMTGIMIFIILVFGEITPKQIALQFNQQFMIMAILPLFLCFVLLRPLSLLLSVFTKIFSRPLMKKNIDQMSGISKEHMFKMFYLARMSGAISHKHVSMVTRMLSISEHTIEQIITHRTDIISISSRMTIQDARKFVKNCPYNNLPVYKDDLKEQIIGIVETKDIESVYQKPTTYITEIITWPLCTNINKTIEEVLDLMQQTNVELAIVLDEYGGLKGMITLHDIIGYIFSSKEALWSHKEKSKINHWVKIDGNRYMINGITPLNDLAEYVGISIQQENIESKTIGGYLQEQLKGLPSLHDKVTTEYGELEVNRIKHNRITSILWTPPKMHTPQLR